MLQNFKAEKIANIMEIEQADAINNNNSNNINNNIVEKQLVFNAKTENARSIVNILTTLVKKGEQIASVTITPDCLSFVIEEGKVYQGICRISSDFFNEYMFAPSEGILAETFRINFGTLMECLNIYGSHSSNFSLQILYEGYGNNLVLR